MAESKIETYPLFLKKYSHESYTGCSSIMAGFHSATCTVQTRKQVSRGAFLYVPKGFAGTIRPSETAQPREIGLQTPTVSFHLPFALRELE